MLSIVAIVNESLKSSLSATWNLPPHVRLQSVFNQSEKVYFRVRRIRFNCVVSARRICVVPSVFKMNGYPAGTICSLLA